MKIFDAESTRLALSFERLIPALAEMFVLGCEVPQRHSHTITGGDGSSSTLLLMPAWQVDRYLGIKTVAITPRNISVGLPGLYSTYMLYDATTGEPLALMDGNEITSRRTAAASALAASHLARATARRMLLVGAGRVASLLPQAYRAVRPIETVVIWDINYAMAHALAVRLNEQGFNALVATDLAGAARSADVICCATLATEPVIHGEWLLPGTHLDLIGSFTPQMRETDDACFKGSCLYIDTEEALLKSGDLLGPMERGVFAASHVRGTLAGLCRRTCTGRATDEERSVFKSVGTALEDLAAAIMVFESQP